MPPFLQELLGFLQVREQLSMFSGDEFNPGPFKESIAKIDDTINKMISGININLPSNIIPPGAPR